MLNKEDAIRFEPTKYGKVYIFSCGYPECNKEIRSYERKFSNHSGYCRTHSHARLDKPFISTYNHLKDGVRRTNKKRNRDIEFDLSYEDFLFLTQIGVCYYCGESNIEWREFCGDGNFRYNLDRKDNTKGYTFENVVVCCKTCNLIKRDWFDADEFRAISLLLRRWRSSSLTGREELILMLSSWGEDISILL